VLYVMEAKSGLVQTPVPNNVVRMQYVCTMVKQSQPSLDFKTQPAATSVSTNTEMIILFT